MSKSTLHAVVGFIPLTDSAPLVVAKELGFFEEAGIDVKLQAQHSWATLRDKLHAGVLDAAQMLAPMPLASQLGLAGPKVEVIAPMVLSLNGNAITLSNFLMDEIQSENGISDIKLPMAAYLLQKVIKKRKKQGLPKIKLASVYPYSCHFYQLCEWLKSGGIDIADIDLIVFPPISMVDALHCGDIDGYCVGGPWNAKAVRAGFGSTVLTSYDIWRDSPEKVLGILSTFYEKQPEAVEAICVGLKRACEWLESIPNRFEAARILTHTEYLDAPLDVIAPSLLGSCLVNEDLPPRQVIGYNQFYSLDTDINMPSHSAGEWLLQQMQLTQQLDHVKVPDQLVSGVYRKDIYKSAMRSFKALPSKST